MPIKIDIVDNSSTVRVKPKNNAPVDASGGEAAFDHALATKLTIETKERKAADTDLQNQLDKKPSQFELNYTEDTGELKLDAFDKNGNPVATTSTIIEIPPAADFITLDRPHGILPEDLLNYLIANKLNKLVYLDGIYSLSMKDSRYWRYMGATTDPNTLNTIVVDIVTGEYTYSEIGNAVLQNHINDNDRHIRPGERDFWNNKLNLATTDELLEFNRN